MLSELLGLLPAVLFGLWLAIFPNSVVRFYTWFHKGKVKMPKNYVIRMSGVVWILWILTVIFILKK